MCSVAGLLASGMGLSHHPRLLTPLEQWLMRDLYRLQWRDRAGVSPASLFIRSLRADTAEYR